ncbi:exonuclease domain-containing protein [Brucella rhizosphaerae]|uniref:Exonuclease family protein n=1 Tax=Brucella rhizosphaerae TaxID=571254 RepID=A0A256FL45_9HYPH|nr:exonuclease domain-containing protein [Brucella rhizosphaerae]OYR15539.1 exonuclease family protein [Brucella rhizosphaerae]
MNYFVIDVETANADYASICQIGLVEVKNGEVVGRESHLINPDDYFDSFNVSIHGISEDNVRDSPPFSDIYASVLPKLRDAIVVHHGPFDRVAFNRSYEKYGLDPLDVQWLDNQRVVRRTWEEFASSGYALKNLARHFKINFNHHDALEDALTTQKIFNLALEKSGVSAADWITLANHRNNFFDQGRALGQGNQSGPFFGETIVFTGSLRVGRVEASEIAKRLGFNVEAGVTKRTTVLCAGVHDRTRTGGYDKSSKHRKSEELKLKGQDIRILSEDDFWAIVPAQIRPNLLPVRSNVTRETQSASSDLSFEISLDSFFTEEELSELLAELENYPH